MKYCFMGDYATSDMQFMCWFPLKRKLVDKLMLDFKSFLSWLFSSYKTKVSIFIYDHQWNLIFGRISKDISWRTKGDLLDINNNWKWMLDVDPTLFLQTDAQSTSIQEVLLSVFKYFSTNIKQQLTSLQSPQLSNRVIYTIEMCLIVPEAQIWILGWNESSIDR